MQKNILIVGGSGFIGHNLAKTCLNRFKVTCLSLNKINKEKKLNKVKYIIADISKKKDLKKKILKRYDIVINLGGYIDHKNKSLALKTHFNGCKNLVNFFYKRNIELFIQIGSSTEYGKQKSPNIENNNGKPNTIYAQSKLKASKFLIKFSKKNFFPFVILRFYQVYGPEQNYNRLIPMVINSAINNLNFKCSSGTQGKDFIYISDAVDAIMKCFNNKLVIGKVINIGSGYKITIKNLILKIVNSIGKGKPIFGVLKMRSDEPKNSFPNITIAKKVLGWRPKITLDSGLKKTIKYYKKKNNEL